MNAYRQPAFIKPDWLYEGAALVLKRDLDVADRGTLGEVDLIFEDLIIILFQVKSDKPYPVFWECVYDKNSCHEIKNDWEPYIDCI